jgi:hypothetical protein
MKFIVEHDGFEDRKKVGYVICHEQAIMKKHNHSYAEQTHLHELLFCGYSGNIVAIKYALDYSWSEIKYEVMLKDVSPFDGHICSYANKNIGRAIVSILCCCGRRARGCYAICPKSRC